jgi:hypothetical protein
MPPPDRMFHVIVAGGIALVALPSAAATGCGGAVSSTSDAGSQGDGFPVEGVDTGYFPVEGPPPPLEAGADAIADVRVDAIVDAGVDADAFPHEGPNLEAGWLDVGIPEASVTDAPQEAAADAAGAPDGFPHETAAP